MLFPCKREDGRKNNPFEIHANPLSHYYDRRSIGISKSTFFGRDVDRDSWEYFMFLELLGLLMKRRLSTASFSAWFCKILCSAPGSALVGVKGGPELLDCRFRLGFDNIGGARVLSVRRFPPLIGEMSGGAGAREGGCIEDEPATAINAAAAGVEALCIW
jgi:hypothetical protein